MLQKGNQPSSVLLFALPVPLMRFPASVVWAVSAHPILTHFEARPCWGSSIFFLLWQSCAHCHMCAYEFSD